VGFLRAISDAVGWLYDPLNRDEAFAIYNHNMAGAVPSAAATAYSVLFDPMTGFPRNGDIDVEGIRQVLALPRKVRPAEESRCATRSPITIPAFLPKPLSDADRFCRSRHARG